jgi:transposase
VSWAKKHANGGEIVFCMESTGGYEFDLACHLADAGEFVCVENPRRIKHMAIGLGFSNKTDRADAQAIAAYALVAPIRPWVLSDERRRTISRLCRHRENLVEDLRRIRNRREHALPELQARHLEAQETLLVEQMEEVEKETARLVEECSDLRERVAILMPLSGVGLLTALTVLSEMPDVALFDDAETWASQAGLFPCRRESGQWKGQTRMSYAGNAHVRRVIYMGATAAKQGHPAVKALAERLEERGKKKKQIRIACMRKMLMLCFGVLKAHSQGKTPFYGLPPQKEAIQP